MNNIGIISGGGKLPLAVGHSLLQNKYSVHFFPIKNFCKIDDFQNYNYTIIEIKSFSKILKTLKNSKIDKIIMIGNITRPSIKDLKFDFSTIGLIKDYFLESKGDDKLLKTISNLFLKNGYPLFEWKNKCHDLFSSKDHLTKIKPSKNAIKNLNKGLEIFKFTGRADIGQSLIVQSNLILGIECTEGTDELIKRCSKYKKNNDKGILIKLSKYDQHNSLDIPAVGLKTIENLYKNNYEGIFLEKNNCVIIDKDKIINFCNKNKLFLME